MTDLYIGMLSGTSRDGVDLVLVSFENDRPDVKLSLCLPYPAELAEFLHQVVTRGKRPTDNQLQKGESDLTGFFSHSVMQLLATAKLEPTSITAIGSHGQTVWHAPPESIQLGDPHGIARHTGITTVGDFRQADLQCGGQGAPLAPLLHRGLFRPASGRRIVLNLGGIANISVLGHEGEVLGFDTGPANCLLDGWIREHRGESFDRNGDWSAGGRVNPMLLLDLLSDPFFKKPAPKSTGVEYFNQTWLNSRARLDGLATEDVQATLAQLTASSVAAAMAPFGPDDVLVCGGGAHNRDLLSRLQALLPDCPVQTTQDHGLHPDCVEGVLFAWLARERLAGHVLDTRRITGASKPVLLGEIATPAAG